MSQRRGFDSESTNSSPFSKGYPPFNSEPNQYHCWITLQRSLVYEDGLGKVMSGVESAPAALEEDATQLQRAQYAKESRQFEEKNGKLFTRIFLATADCRQGYAFFAAQVVQAYAPVGTALFGDARGEAKYRRDVSPGCKSCTISLPICKLPRQINTILLESNPGIAPHLCQARGTRRCRSSRSQDSRVLQGAPR